MEENMHTIIVQKTNIGYHTRLKEYEHVFCYRA